MEPDGSNSNQNVVKGMVKVCMSISGILRKLKGQGQVTKGHYM